MAKRESRFPCVTIFFFWSDISSMMRWRQVKLSIYKTCAMCNGKSEKSEIRDRLSVVLATNKGLCDTNVVCFVCCRNTETVAACWEVHTGEIRWKSLLLLLLSESLWSFCCLEMSLQGVVEVWDNVGPFHCVSAPQPFSVVVCASLQPLSRMWVPWWFVLPDCLWRVWEGFLVRFE